MATKKKTTLAIPKSMHKVNFASIFFLKSSDWKSTVCQTVLFNNNTPFFITVTGKVL